MTTWRSAGVLLLASLLGAACTEDSYVVGALCSAIATCPDGAGNAGASGTTGGAAAVAGGGSGGSQPTLSLDLTGSGPERLPEPLFGTKPSDFLLASDATTQTWKARIGAGFNVSASAGLALGEPGPFADSGSVLRHAGAVTFGSNSSWADTSAGALALEAVFRGEPGAVLLSQRDASGGLEWSLDADGRLLLRLDSGARELVAVSQALVVDAWHHCLALFDAGQGALQVFCNGQAGDSVNVPADFVLTPPQAAAEIGSDSAARLYWAELARWQAPAWAPRGSWTDLARERFARLVGTYAEGAQEPLPFADVRASGAYIDMSPAETPELRRLHPVGEHWPRIVCRPTSDAPRTCGLLVEAASSQQTAQADFTFDNWTASELSITPKGGVGATGADTLYGLTPSGSAVAHALELQVPLADGPAVFAFFARAGSAVRLRAEVVDVASATFDLQQPSVVDSVSTFVSAAEPWGDGLLRLSFSFDVMPGPGRLRLTLLDKNSAPAFAGDGSVGALVGDAELRFRSFSTPLPTFGAIEQADHLTYPAGNGNLPKSGGLTFGAEIWLPSAPLLADAAILNANFATRYDQQINLFVSSQNGTAQFWSLQGKATPWQVFGTEALTDGKLHSVEASIGASSANSATLTIDGASSSSKAEPYDLSVLDRVEIGTSTSSSGPLSGIVRHVRIKVP